MLLVQFKQADGQRRIGVLEDECRKIRVVEGYNSTYGLAQAAIAADSTLKALAAAGLGDTVLDYDTVAQARQLLPPLEHGDSAHCYVTGTGLTHLGSADGRDAMHKKISDVDTLTDSMKMFRMGLEGGKPAAGEAGVQPEWFYKGDGSIVRAAEQPLTMPHFALDGGEEPEIAALYVIGPDGDPYRLGFAIGNEFSDHVTERQNYLYLAHSKLRVCAVGPALLVGDLPAHVAGMSRIRDSQGQVRWEKPFVSGEENMSHTVANLEYHHFKYPLFRRPGDVHIHFFGTATLSCSDGIQVAHGETFEIDVAAFGPPLRNRLAVETLAAPRIHQL
ncbi:sugar transporter [Collimonas arenae]|uniref:Sugar transporter n=1 Tax=Collimonas arenae TaxID=279058 RepID=A0A0A1FG05_9BURK|nr:AraD1 family protein [Collimonas arenae]AIY42614.1 sugar transporter [Collimonas arenae]